MHLSTSSWVRSFRAAALGLATVLALVAAVPSAIAQNSLPVSSAGGEDEVGVLWVGEPAIVETVDQIMARQALQPPVGAMHGTGKPDRFQPKRSLLPQDPDSPEVSSWPPGAPYPLEEFGERAPQTIGTDFLAVDDGESGFYPPDTHGDVSPTQILITLNGRIKVFTKAGTAGPLNADFSVFFNSVRNGSTVVDPRVVFDKISNRWFVCGITVSTPNRVVLAVSSGPTITGAASFSFFQFQQDLVGTTPNADTGDFADYPSLGVDANCVTIGVNMFAPSFNGSTGFVIRKSSLLTGTLNAFAFRQMCAAAGPGPFAPRGVVNDDPAATQGYFIGSDNTAFGRLVLRRISTPGATPTLGANINLTVPTTVDPQLVPAQGSGTGIEPTNDRLFEARIRRNRIANVRSLWTAHAIEVNSSGVASATGNRNGARWYEIRNFTGTPTLTQSGTLFDNAASAADHYIYPTVAMTGQGHMALGASVGATGRFMSAATAGRLRTDTLGAIQAPVITEAGTAAYNQVFAGRNRWGDYSSTIVDMADDQTMWTIQEYCNGVDSWAVRTTQLRAPRPAAPTSASPASLAQGSANVNVVITGTSASGTAFYDTDSGYNRIAALVSGSGVTVNSVTFNSETQVTLNVSVTGGAAAGARNVTITNPDGQVATGNGIVTITGGCTPPSITTGPSAATRCVGTSVTFSVVAAGTGPLTFQWRRNSTDIPGATAASYTDASVAIADAGTYDVVVTNACGSSTSAGALLTVQTGVVINTQPAPLVRCTGTSATFSVNAGGSTPINFQWRRNGTNIPGGIGSSLIINPVVAGSVGTYDVIVSNACSSVTSTAVALTVNSGITITDQPDLANRCVGTSVSFTVVASGTAPITFQWRRNSVNIAGATSATYADASVSVGDAGTYDVVVTNTCGSVTSNGALLTVSSAPTITTQPSSVTTCLGGNVSFSVVAAGNGLTYQWLFNAANIPGATTPTLNINNVTAANQGTYTVRVTNACGSVLSVGRFIFLCPGDWDCDGDTDSDDIVGFFNDWEAGNGDSDGDEDSDSDDVAFFFTRWEAGC